MEISRRETPASPILFFIADKGLLVIKALMAISSWLGSATEGSSTRELRRD
jgi:hypothetical protein